jgi:hypothetical protein
MTTSTTQTNPTNKPYYEILSKNEDSIISVKCVLNDEIYTIGDKTDYGTINKIVDINRVSPNFMVCAEFDGCIGQVGILNLKKIK